MKANKTKHQQKPKVTRGPQAPVMLQYMSVNAIPSAFPFGPAAFAPGGAAIAPGGSAPVSWRPTRPSRVATALSSTESNCSLHFLFTTSIADVRHFNHQLPKCHQSTQESFSAKVKLHSPMEVTFSLTK